MGPTPTAIRGSTPTLCPPILGCGYILCNPHSFCLLMVKRLLGPHVRWACSHGSMVRYIIFNPRSFVPLMVKRLLNPQIHRACSHGLMMWRYRYTPMTRWRLPC
ncbi:hypothetical protein Hanom_Chr09g00782281 [Helianthus anomalus]